MVGAVLRAGVLICKGTTVVADHGVFTAIAARDSLLRGVSAVRAECVSFAWLKVLVHRDTVVKHEALSLKEPFRVLL
jgi:hypothetical protein